MAIKFASNDAPAPKPKLKLKSLEDLRALVPTVAEPKKVVNKSPAAPAIVNNDHRPNVNIALPALTGKVKMVGVRMTEDEIAAIDAARGKVSRQDFLRKAALWLADQADRLTGGQ